MELKTTTMACKLRDRDEFVRERLKVRRKLIFDDNEESPNKPPSPPPKHNHMVYEETIGDLVRQKSQKWNFDFENGTPVPGPYEWVEVNKYNLANVTNRFLAVRVDRPSNDEESLTRKNVLYEANENLQRKSSYGKSRNQKFKQTILKDFYKTTKRTAFKASMKTPLTPNLPSHLPPHLPTHHHQMATPLLCFK